MNAAQVYGILMIILMVFMILQSIAMIIIVILQKSAESNIGVLSGSSSSFFGRGKAKTIDEKLKRVTIGLAAGMLLNSILFFVFFLLRSRIG
ncbi:MAG: preprotein translocase subunit SecG [Christensenellales bacterium]|jgi:preprotein translocase subunit SecG|nr:preprotein translocase subunit SecG [Clostridiales bacterium]